MAAVRLICWREDLAKEHARFLETAGFQVDASTLNPPGIVSHLRTISPEAVIIDLDRLPSHGREVAVALRGSKATRHIPILFAGGAPEKVERIRDELPDAFFSDWKHVASALKKALKAPPADPIRPTAHMERYRGSSLVTKLGLKPAMKVALIGAPEGFAETLGELPDGVQLQTRLTPQTKLALWFVRSRAELERELEYLSAWLDDASSIWIIHPKQSGKYPADFNQRDVRAAGLRAGLVDYKVCAVDADWSGLKFARKKAR